MTGVAGGTATITATTSNSATATYKVYVLLNVSNSDYRVIPVTGMEFDKSNSSGISASNGIDRDNVYGLKFSFSGGNGVKYNNSDYLLLSGKGKISIERTGSSNAISGVELTYSADNPVTFTYKDHVERTVTLPAGNNVTYLLGGITYKTSVSITMNENGNSFQITQFKVYLRYNAEDATNGLSANVAPTLSYGSDINGIVGTAITPNTLTCSAPKNFDLADNITYTFSDGGTGLTFDTTTGQFTTTTPTANGTATVTATYGATTYFAESSATYSIKIDNALTKFDPNGGETLYGANDDGGRAFVDATSFDYVPGRTQILQTRVDIAPGFSTTGIACNKTNFSVSSSNTTVISIDDDLNVTNANNDNKFYFQNLKIGKPGKTTLTYTFNGAAGYGATSCSIEITINKARQVLAFAEEAVTEQFELDKTYSDNTLTQSVGSGAVTYKSSDTDVATVDANTGVVTIKSVGTVTITATAAAYDNYDKATASYTLTIASPLDWAMTKNLQVEPGTEITSVDGITLRFGGFTNQFGKGSSHVYGSSKDDFNKGHSDVTGISGFYYNEGTNNASYESSTAARGWDRNRSTNEYLGKNLPIYGTFYVFEPKKAGSLTLSVLQTGSVQDVGTGTFVDSPLYDKKLDGTNSYHNGLIDKWDYKALYLIDERGLSVRASNRSSLSTYNHPYEFVGGGDYAEGGSLALSGAQKNQLSLKPHILGTGYGETTVGQYLNQFKYPETTLNELTEGEFTPWNGEGNVEQIKKELIVELSKNLTAEEQKAYNALSTDDARLDYLYPLKLKTENLVDIMENKKYGYWTLTKSHNMYTFPVEAGKTYYLFVDASKVGFSGFSFTVDNTVATTEATIEGADKQTSKVADADYGKRNCTVTLNRTLTADQPNSLMLPFSMSLKKVEEVFGEGTVVLHVKSIDNQIHFVRHHYPMIVAGEPCLIYPKKTQNAWTIDGVTIESRELLNTYEEISGNDFTFTGCLEKVTMNKGSYWVRATKAEGQSSEGNDIYLSQTNAESWMSNTRAFFQNTESNLGAKLTTAFLEDAVDEGNGSETTAISILQTENGTTISKHGVYTLDGRKLSDGIVPKGIYIVDGRKVVVK